MDIGPLRAWSAAVFSRTAACLALLARVPKYVLVPESMRPAVVEAARPGKELLYNPG